MSTGSSGKPEDNGVKNILGKKPQARKCMGVICLCRGSTLKACAQWKLKPECRRVSQFAHY